MAVDSLNQLDSSKATSSHLRDYVRLLKELHFLMAEGKSETDEADRVRDLMDEPWYKMSPEEIRRVEGLSADLYTLVDPPPPPRQADPKDIAETGRLVEAARNDQDWDDLLELLRERPHAYPPDQVAFMRAGCWENLGDLDTSLLFLQKAVSLSPSNGYYVISLMYTLLRVGRPREAILLADRILGITEALDSGLLYKMASALIGSLHAIGDGQQRERIIDKAIESNQKALENEGLLPERERMASSSVAGYINLGMCYRLRGKSDLALGAYNAALEIEPENHAALVGRGLLRFPTDNATAIEDFQKAVRGNSPDVWPYYFYAFHLISIGQVDECLRACRAGLLRTNDPAVTAEFYEWIAIAQDGLGRSRDTVRSSFENARSLAPWNQHIERNYQLFLQAQDAPSVDHPAWSLDRACEAEDASRRLIHQFSSQVNSRDQAA